MAIDWSLNRVPDIAGGTMAGYERGREQSRLRVRNAALAQYGSDPNAGIQSLLPVDPELAIGLQQNQRQEAATAAQAARAIRTEDRETRDRHRARAGQLWVGLLGIPEAQRRDVAIRETQAMGLEGEDLQRTMATLQDPNTAWDDASVAARARFVGADPNAGAYTLGRGDRRIGPTGQTLAEGGPPAPVALRAGDALVDPTSGREIASRAPADRWIPVPEGGSLVNVGGGGVNTTATPGRASGAPAPAVAGPAPSQRDARSVVESLGGVVTSGHRTRERNAAVRGAPNSYHTRGDGQAVDVRPIPGMTFQQFRQQLIDRGLPITELINEGDHWHWAFGGGNRRGGAPAANQTAPGGRETITGAPRRQGHAATPEELRGLGLPPTASVWIDRDGNPQRVDRQGDRPSNSRPPVSVINRSAALQREIGTAATINRTLGNVVRQIDSGALRLGLIENTVSGVRNATGTADANSTNYATFRANLERLRNDSLRLNSGVQTDGDAQRAWAEIGAHPNDPRVIRAQLAIIMDLNEQAIQLRAEEVNQMRADAGLPPIDPAGPARRVTRRPGASGGSGAPAARPAASRPQARPAANADLRNMSDAELRRIAGGR